MANGSIKNCKKTEKSRYISICFDTDVFDEINIIVKEKKVKSFSKAVNRMMRNHLVEHGRLRA